MEMNDIWRSKETKGVFLKILRGNSDGSLLVTFDFRFNPKTFNVFQKWYIEKFYEPIGKKSFWVLGSGLRDIPSNLVKAIPIKVIEDPFDEIDPDKVLFGDYTGEEKKNVWQNV